MNSGNLKSLLPGWRMLVALLLVVLSMALLLTTADLSSDAQRSQSAKAAQVRPFSVSESLQDGEALLVRPELTLLERAGRDGAEIAIPLPSGGEVVSRLNLFESQAFGYFTAGPIVSDPSLGAAGEGEVSVTVYKGHVVGRITRGSEVFLIGERDENGLHTLKKLDQRSLPPDGQPVDVDASKSAETVLSESVGEVVADTNEFVDLLILYTPAATTRYGSTSAIEAEATGAVNNSNLALTNSNSTHRYRLAHLVETNYVESGSTSTDLSRLRTVNDGFIDDAHILRDAHKADVVELLTNAPDDCGLGYLMGPSSVSSGFRTSAFNVTIAACANGNLSMAHEIGHNIGLQHDRANASSSPSFDYAYGFQSPGLARTVMAYACAAETPCPRRPVFSTPLRNFPSSTTVAGTVTEDATRAMELTSVQAANFRDTACTYSVNQTAATAPAAGATGSLVMTTATGCPWSSVTSDTTVATFAGGSWAGGGSISYTVSANTSLTQRTATLTLGGQSVSLTQAPCSVALSSLTESIASAAGSLSVNVTATGCVWTAASNAAWISVTSGASGTGSGTVALGIQENTGAPRSGTVTIAGQTFTVNQSAVAQGSIAGSVRYYFGSTPAVGGVSLAGVGPTAVNATTDSAGAYTLQSLSAGSYTVTPSKTGQVNGIASADAARVAQAVVGLTTLTPNQQIAADATGNGSVASADAARIAQYIVGLNPTGVTGTWKFTPANRTYASVTSALTGEDFTAILVGDVTGNWSPSIAFAEGESLAEDLISRMGEPFPLALRGSRGQTGEYVRMPVSVGDITNRGITAFDIELSYDAEVLEPVADNAADNAGTLSANFFVTANPNTPGRLSVSAYGIAPMSGDGTLINLVFRVKGPEGSETRLKFEKFLMNEDPVKVPDGSFKVGREVRSLGPTFKKK